MMSEFGGYGNDGVSWLTGMQEDGAEVKHRGKQMQCKGDGAKGGGGDGVEPAGEEGALYGVVIVSPTCMLFIRQASVAQGKHARPATTPLCLSIQMMHREHYHTRARPETL